MTIRLKREVQFEVSNLAFGSYISTRTPWFPSLRRLTPLSLYSSQSFPREILTPLTEMEFRQKMREQKVFIIKYLVRALGIT